MRARVERDHLDRDVRPRRRLTQPSCGSDGTGRSRTVWFRVDERDGRVLAELGRP